jgi:hypothetical protein
MDQPNLTQSPCKTFNKRKAITCYKLRWDSQNCVFEHHELYRISNETPGEYYILPIETLQKQTKRHLSYHRSGAFHWREDDGSRVKPRDGEADQRRASLVCQAGAHLSGQLHGYCIARGRNVSDASIDYMIDIMDGYIIPPLKSLGVHLALKERKSYSILVMDSPYRREAQKIMAEAAEKGDGRIVRGDDLIDFVKAQYPKVKCAVLEPMPKDFAVYSRGVTDRLVRLAQEMVMEKMREKPAAFWTGARAFNLTDPRNNI